MDFRRKIMYIFLILLVLILMYLQKNGHGPIIIHDGTGSSMSEFAIRGFPYKRMVLVFYDGSNDLSKYLASIVTLFRRENVAVVTTSDFIEQCFIFGVLCLDMTINSVRYSNSSVKFVKVQRSFELCRTCSIYKFLKSGIEIITLDPTFTCIQEVDIWSVFTNQAFSSYCSSEFHYNSNVLRIQPSTRMIKIFQKACDILFDSIEPIQMKHILVDLLGPVLNADSCSTEIKTYEYLVKDKPTGNIKCVHVTSNPNEQTIKRLKVHSMWHFTKRIRNYGNIGQTKFVYYFRTLHHSKLYPLDVKSKNDFHTGPRFGTHRGLSIARYYLHKWMEDKIQKHTKQNTTYSCLEVGNGQYLHSFFKNVCASKLSLDLYDPTATIKADLESPPSRIFNSFDIIICTFVLEHVSYPHKAMKGMYKVLKRNGIIFLVVPFITPQHGAPEDISRFSKFGVKALAQDANLSITSMETHGNSLTTIGFMLEMSAEDFSKYELEKKDGAQYLAVFSVLTKK